MLNNGTKSFFDLRQRFGCIFRLPFNRSNDSRKTLNVSDRQRKAFWGAFSTPSGRNIKLYFKSSLFFSFKMIFTTIKKIIYTRYMKAYLHVSSLYASFQFLYFPLSCILKDGLGERTRLKIFSLGPC